MKEFGSRAYEDVVYINFDANVGMAELFAADLNVDRLLMGIELYAGRKIDAESTGCTSAYYWRGCVELLSAAPAFLSGRAGGGGWAARHGRGNGFI
ncbi:MAG: hypothetical protein K2K90_05780 [Lachnospiraceae bacterium]|nr:hypothetical protein [Lachnospiraceae bacterium]